MLFQVKKDFNFKLLAWILLFILYRAMSVLNVTRRTSIHMQNHQNYTICIL